MACSIVRMGSTAHRTSAGAGGFACTLVCPWPERTEGRKGTRVRAGPTSAHSQPKEAR
jgi:hypothetical protein